MALNYGPQELDKHISHLAKKFEKFADDNIQTVDELSKYQKLAIADKYFMLIELTERSLDLFVRLTEEYIKRKK